MGIESLTSNRTVLPNLQYLAKEYEHAFNEAEKQVKAAEERRDTCWERLAKARSLLEYERERVGAQLPMDDTSPYAGLRLREAVLRVIQEGKGKEVTFGEIKDKLREHGYPLDMKYYGRALHAALIGVDEVVKVAPATYRLRVQPSVDRETRDQLHLNSPLRLDEVTVEDN